MPFTIQDVNTLQQYIQGVMARASDHAGQVTAIALALAGAIVWRKDNDDPIEVMEVDGELKNVLWVREGTTQGRVIQTFDNGTSVTQVESVFRNL